MYERVNHEILTVQHVLRKDGKRHPVTGLTYHVVRQHHTMYAHAALTADAAAIPAGGIITLTLRLHPWDIATEQVDTGTVLADEDRTFALLVNGEQVGELTTAGGEVSETLQLTDPGTYAVEVQHPTAQGATVEVTVT